MKHIKLMTFILSSALLVSCGNDNSSTSHSEFALKDKDTLVRGNAFEPESLDPIHVQTNAAASILYDVGEGLMSEDQANNPVPGVAKSYEVSKDGMTYTFYLRDDAKWSNGESITAEDFVYAFKRAVDPNMASEMAYKLAPIQNAQAIMDGKKPVSSLGVKALDAHTIQIQLDYPVYYFLSIVADPISYPVYKEGVDQYGQSFFQAGKLISNGAYKLKEWVPNGYVLVTKNSYYWDAKNVHIQNVKFLPIVERMSALNAYASGQVDYLMYVPSVNLDTLEKKYGDQLKATSWLALEYLDFNLTRPPFKDNKDLREALSLAIDREALVKQVIRDGSIAAYSFFPADIDEGRYKDIKYTWSDWGQEKRLELAKQLYTKAGYSKINPLRISIEYNTDEKNKKVMEAIAQMWTQNLGVKVNLVNSEFKVFLKIRQTHNYDGVARDGWAADFNTIDNFASMWTCNNPQNNVAYCNPEYDNLILEGRKQLIVDDVVSYYTKALNIVQNDYPVAPLFVHPVIHLVKPYVQNYNMQTNHLDHVYDKWFSFKYQS